MLVFIKRYGERDNILVFLVQGLFQQRVAGLSQVQFPVLVDNTL